MNSKSTSRNSGALTIVLVLFVNASICGQKAVVDDYKENENTNTVHIDINKNVELFGYMVHLAEPPENDPNHPISVELNQWPGDINNRALNRIYELAADISYEFFINLFVHLPDFPLSGEPHIPQKVLDKYDYTSMEEISLVNELINLTNEFYLSSNFEEVWLSLAPYRSETIETVKTAVEIQNIPEILNEMEAFYEQDFSRYMIVPSLTLWTGPAWGLRDQNTQNGTVFVLGPLNHNFDYAESTRLKSLAIHEFGHSFVNHLVLQNLTNEIKETDKLYSPIKEAMIPQGYANWEQCIIEHFVRAGEVLIPEIMGNVTLSQSNLKANTEEKNFIYLPYIVDQLRYYSINQRLSYNESLRKTMIDVRKQFLEGK